MKNQKELIFFSIIFLIGIFSFISLSSAVLINPVASSTISGQNAVLNATNTSITNMTNCLFYALSPSTANSSWVLLKNLTNMSANPLNINGTFDSRVLEDSNDYQFNATCYNITGLLSLTNSVNTGITVDNTQPGSPTSLSPSDNNLITSKTDINYSSTVIDANTTSCTFNIGLNGGNYQTYTGTYSGATCSYLYGSYNDSSANGNYYWYFTASDGTNTSQSSTFVNQVQLPGTGGGLTEDQANAVASGTPVNQALAITSGNSNISTSTIVFILIIVIVIIIIWVKVK